MRLLDKESWADAVFVDAALRTSERAQRFGGEIYLHKSLTPLGEIPSFPNSKQYPLAFGDEGEEMCGV